MNASDQITNRDVDGIVEWFRVGLRAKLFDKTRHAIPQEEMSPRPFTDWAQEAGEKLANQILCEYEGHDDEVTSWHDVKMGRSPAFIHYHDHECRKCERYTRVVVAQFDDQDEWGQYCDRNRKR